MRAVTWAERGLRQLPLPQWLRPAIGGLLVSNIAVFVPQVLGSGHGAIQLVFDGDFALSTLVLILAAKLVASAISLGSGFRGGMFSASLSSAACWMQPSPTWRQSSCPIWSNSTPS